MLVKEAPGGPFSVCCLESLLQREISETIIEMDKNLHPHKLWDVIIYPSPSFSGGYWNEGIDKYYIHGK